ncbi:hypothetical protein QTQ03_07675 [Micromonospora sp. WMMA1363]|uniref:hypothetical protein n=1 Tax=Micromonospora sp. WMMA1363 TaxID=3053985 RepID=UPI00259CD561|nr:hypothetical protein [Micromonospora sp. WMMA1363]MDM4719482.1 hypothetical protein [Micromonospora sp. WMMA1363]
MAAALGPGFRCLGDLQDPEAFRSWLVAITIRQVRDWEQRRRTATHRHAPPPRPPASYRSGRWP